MIFLRFFIFCFAFVWILPVHSKNSLIQRRLTAMNDPQISYQGAYIKQDDQNGFSGEIEFKYQDNTLKNPSNNFFSGYFAQFKGGWIGEIGENFDWGVRIASGGWGQNSLIDSSYIRQVENNRDQTFGGFSGSPLWLDNLYISYFLKDFSVRVGQVENPYFDSSRYNVIWDEDLTPSGIVFQYEKQLKDRYTFSLLGSGFVISPLSPWTSNSLEISEEDEYGLNRYMWAGSGRFEVAFDDYDFILQTAYYNIQSKGMELPSHSQSDRVVLPNRVSDASAESYVHEDNFSILDIALQMRIKNFWKPVLAQFQIVQNFLVEEEALGIVTGGYLGDSREKGSWNLGYHFFSLERDVTMDYLTNSDIGGKGSEYKGHTVEVNYFVNSSVRVGVQYILREDQGDQEAQEAQEDSDHAFFISLNVAI